MHGCAYAQPSLSKLPGVSNFLPADPGYPSGTDPFRQAQRLEQLPQVIAFTLHGAMQYLQNQTFFWQMYVH